MAFSKEVEKIEEVPEKRKTRPLVTNTCAPTTGNVERLSLAKLVRVTAYMQRFCHNGRYPNEKQTGHFKASDWRAALYACTYMVQQAVYHEQIAISNHHEM